jgi:hypothetical protein
MINARAYTCMHIHTYTHTHVPSLLYLNSSFQSRSETTSRLASRSFTFILTHILTCRLYLSLISESIGDYIEAGIKVWMLTGDKRETAKNIALACNLIDPGT